MARWCHQRQPVGRQDRDRSGLVPAGHRRAFRDQRDTLRRSLFEQTAGMFPELVTRSDLQVFLPPIGGITVYLFGDVEKLSDPHTRDHLPGARRMQRFGRFRLRHLHLPAVPAARHRGMRAFGAGRRARHHRLQSQGRPRARRSHQVPGLQRAQAAGGRRRRGRPISSAPNASPASRMRASSSSCRMSLHWLGLRRIDRFVSMSDMKYDALVGQGVEIVERVPIPDELVPRGRPCRDRRQEGRRLLRADQPRQARGPQHVRTAAREILIVPPHAAATFPCSAPKPCASGRIACWRSAEAPAAFRRHAGPSRRGRRPRHRDDARGLSLPRRPVPFALAPFRARRRGSLGRAARQRRNGPTSRRARARHSISRSSACCSTRAPARLALPRPPQRSIGSAARKGLRSRASRCSRRAHSRRSARSAARGCGRARSACPTTRWRGFQVAAENPAGGPMSAAAPSCSGGSADTPLRPRRRSSRSRRQAASGRAFRSPQRRRAASAGGRPAILSSVLRHFGSDLAVAPDARRHPARGLLASPGARRAATRPMAWCRFTSCRNG